MYILFGAPSLASQLDVMSHYASASFNKAVISIPVCCVLPEDMISGLAMQGKPVALSQGATTLVIKAALTVGHARLATC